MARNPENFTSPYPVVDFEASMGKCFSNLTPKEMGAIVLAPSVGFAWGWFGSPKSLRYHGSRFNAFVGLMMGMCWAYQGSSQRFFGLRPNEDLVKKYGCLTPDEVKIRVAKASHQNAHFIDWHYDEPQAKPPQSAEEH